MPRVARFRMAPEFLRQMLHLPSDATIEQVTTVSEYGLAEVEVTVSHRELDDVPEGEVPLVSPVMRSQPPIVLEGWKS